ncbi:MAG: hypothetical protein NT120_04540 [Candidatus Aenigmarchaeota archaeon]|nr:hypothetical protein [Candidatus Aenigmarchaeota archaeon]
MSSEEDLKKRIKEAYYQEGRPSTKKYMLILAVIILVVIGFFVYDFYMPSQYFGDQSTATTVRTQEDAQRVTQNTSQSLKNTVNNLDNILKGIG